MSDRDDLRRAIDDLESAMRDLQAELEAETNTRGAGPQLPTVQDVLRFADQAAIPAVIAVLEANIRILEAMQQAVRLAERSPQSGRQSERSRQLAEFGEETLAQLTSSLDDLQRLIEAGSLPQEETARSILTDARELQDRLEAHGETAGEQPADQRDTDDDSEEVTIDIDAELESIKDEYEDDEDDDAPPEDDED